MAAMKTPSPADLLCILTRLDQYTVELLSVNEKAPIGSACDDIFDDAMREDHAIGDEEKGILCVLNKELSQLNIIMSCFSLRKTSYQILLMFKALKSQFVLTK